MKKTTILSISIIIISFAIALYLYPQMPEKMASHWNASGNVDGYMSRFWGTFLMPIVLLALFFLLVWIPTIDPLKKNIEKFRKYYDGFILFMIAFLFYIYLLTIVWNLGKGFNMTLWLLPAMGILFYYLGILIENAKRNWFIGIRTPWTLSSDIVWAKTHKLGGKLFKALAAVIVIGMFLGKNSIWFILVPVLAVTIYIIVYSYFMYQKEIKTKK
jgi:uncharacterized membrane protein